MLETVSCNLKKLNCELLKFSPLLLAKDKTGQRWEPGHQPLLQNQNGATLRRISYFYFEFISNGEERKKNQLTVSDLMPSSLGLLMMS